MSERLKEIFQEDQAERVGKEKEWRDPQYTAGVTERDVQRREEVLRYINEGQLVTADDYYYAAMVFQHGRVPVDYLLANALARKAMDLGSPRAPWLAAASWDRYLLNSGHQTQQFGTQYRQNAEGKYELVAVDPTTTDEERTKFGLPPRAQLKRFMNR